MQPLTTTQNIWTINPATGLLTATLSGTVLKIATNDNTIPSTGSQYSGNGDTDAWNTGSPDANHSPAQLQLVKLS